MGDTVAVKIKASSLTLLLTKSLACKERLGGRVQRVRGGNAVGTDTAWFEERESHTCVRAAVKVAGAVFDPNPLAIFAPI